MRFDTSALSGGAAGFASFAAANGLSYEAVAPAPAFGGALFDYLQNATVTDRFSAPAGSAGFEVGTIEGTVGGSQSRTTGNFTVTTSLSTTSRRAHGYLAIQLDRRLPQFVLDAKKNDRTFGSSIPMPIARSQRLSLEGDFDDHFALYCPEGYERDALYVFTPDLMALLIDETGDLDVEIVDDHLFVYANQPFDLADPLVWDRLARIREVVGAKALSQTDRYADDRVGDRASNVIGQGGQRLQQGFLGTNPGRAGGVGALRWVALGIVAGVVVIFGVVITIVVVAFSAVAQR